MSIKNDPGRSPLPSSPPEAWEPLLRFTRLAGRPLERFLRIEAASGILLLVAAAVALVWANSRWAESYFHLWNTPIGIRVGAFAFERTLAWFVNDGLMVIFFFVVGMEIRREIHHGELSEWRRAALPAAAALGGMLAPAALYLAFAGAPATRSGWGVPMATDIAFAVGILTLLGKRVPAALRVLLLALAVIDDLGAIVVIALFYSSGIVVSGLLVAAAGFGGVLLMQRFGVRVKLAYVLPALVAWAGIYAAGVHPTIAGVLVGLVTPVRAWLGPEGFVAGIRGDIEQLAKAPPEALSSHELAGTLRHVDALRREAMSPAESLIESLHPWVAFGIMPVFALANAGVSVTGGSLDPAAWRVFVAVAVGLVVGKPLGVLLASAIVLRLRVAMLPRGMRLRHLVVLGVVAGVGFTMALFIAQLAFEDASLLAAAKLGVLAASGAAAIVGLVLGRLLLAPVQTAGAAQTADEAESSTEA
ncbi:Na+/H+ antiporter NhaA [Polyangium sorediatum]|uniref:Na(+)/H(+) antiporter NhaA n=1 Tax=Polyangium sorediatum TaxID=889274 RepID=A0ABT6P5E2_9BACT|nr:Na+/H+ antiporter NhaA [Polyangium sorediatum]MDI1435773.1 Na+/H+ antiporter NhaA [Polyangium sorediatum]